ncbi:MAG: hypothetical protein NT007_10000 [Candidatus Kapabacteria bacterium]|nr:hypothetical protein [Candidatus Kapabacteria bacterium]
MADNTTTFLHLSYPELIVTCNEIHTYMVRDATEFTTFGITSTITTAFKTKIDAFEALPTDTELAAVLVSATAAKNTIANDLRIMLRGIDVRAKMCFSSDMGKYSLFHSPTLSKLSDAELLIFSRMVKRSADLYHTELAVYGLTSTMITDLDTKSDDFETAIDTQRNAVAARDMATNNRTKKATELYDLLMSYCDIGKVIWYETNEAKYNDYVIYGTSGSGLAAPTGFDGIFGITPAPHIDMTWDAVSGATSYDIYYSQVEVGQPAGTFSLQQNIASAPASMVPLPDKLYYFYIIAKNSTQTSSHSTTISVNTTMPV